MCGFSPRCSLRTWRSIRSCVANTFLQPLWEQGTGFRAMSVSWRFKRWRRRLEDVVRYRPQMSHMCCSRFRRRFPPGLAVFVAECWGPSGVFSVEFSLSLSWSVAASSSLRWRKVPPSLSSSPGGGLCTRMLPSAWNTGGKFSHLSNWKSRQK